MKSAETEIREELRRRGMTIRAAAEAAGMTPAALYTALQRGRIRTEQYILLRQMLRENPPEERT